MQGDKARGFQSNVAAKRESWIVRNFVRIKKVRRKVITVVGVCESKIYISICFL